MRPPPGMVPSLAPGPVGFALALGKGFVYQWSTDAKFLLDT